MKNSFFFLFVSIFLCSLTSVIGQDNLLNFPIWETGTGNTTGYTKYGSDANNIREMGAVPHNQYNNIVWKAVPGTGVRDGGWDANTIAIGNNDAYRFTTWVKKGTATSGSFLYGFYAYDGPNPVTANRLDVTYQDGSTFTNPWNAYFVWDSSDKVPDDGNWYLVVSYVYGNSVTQFKTDAGVYDLNGTKVYSNIKQFKVPSNTTHVRHRNYLISTNDAQDVLTFWYPTVYSMNGNEPSISELLNPTASSADTMAPTVPTGVTASNITATTVDLSWTPSTDNGGGTVAGYNIMNNGGFMTSVTGTSTTLSSLTANTQYNITVQAYDDATPANVSAASSPSAQFTTLSSGGGNPPSGGSVWSEQNSVASYANNVAIGTTTVPSTYKLAVNGKVIAEEVRVELSNNGVWPDYVFDKDYALPTLEEIEKHIQEKGHLINVPSAKEVEENGVQLGKMNKILLEKIEELTLYILKQQHQMENLQSQIDHLKENNTEH